MDKKNIILIFLVLFCSTIIICGYFIYDSSRKVDNKDTNDELSERDNRNQSINQNINNKYENGTAIYYNPVSGEVCTDYVESNSLNENKTGCMKWYTFNDTEGTDTVNLILDHNTTATLSWNTDGNGGTNVTYEESDIKTEVDKLVSVSKWVNTPRLISAEEIAQITGYPSWNQDCFFLDSNSTTMIATRQGASKYAWLYDYTNKCTSYGCNVADSSNEGYWTSTTEGTAGSDHFVGAVIANSLLNFIYASDPTTGIRPVITISKSKLF